VRSTRRTNRYHWAWHRWARFIAQRLILRSVVFSTVRVTVEGEANLEELKRPYLVVANHSSHLDAPLLVTALPWRITRHMAVAVAADYFYEQRWRRTLTSFFFNSYPVERGRGKKREAGLSVTLLRENVPLAIFPEGTRSRTGKMGTFKPGVAALARALRAPVLPVALVGAHEAMPPGSSWPKAGRLPVKVIIGKPIQARPGEKLPDLNDRVATQVRHMVTNQTPYVLVPESAPSGHEYDDGDQAREETARVGDDTSRAGSEAAGETSRHGREAEPAGADASGNDTNGATEPVPAAAAAAGNPADEPAEGKRRRGIFRRAKRTRTGRHSNAPTDDNAGHRQPDAEVDGEADPGGQR